MGMPALALLGTMSAIPVLRQMRNMLTWRSLPAQRLNSTRTNADGRRCGTHRGLRAAL